MKTPEEIYDILDKALAEKKAEGWEIRSNGGLPNDEACCAVQALVGNFNYIQGIESRLGVQYQNAWAIIDGFDGRARREGSEELYQVGQRLRAKYLS